MRALSPPRRPAARGVLEGNVHPTFQVFQRRNTGQLDFFKRWRTYVDGFGDPTQEFWLGTTFGNPGGLGCGGRIPPHPQKAGQAARGSSPHSGQVQGPGTQEPADRCCWGHVAGEVLTRPGLGEVVGPSQVASVLRLGPTGRAWSPNVFNPQEQRDSRASGRESGLSSEVTLGVLVIVFSSCPSAPVWSRCLWRPK